MWGTKAIRIEKLSRAGSVEIAAIIYRDKDGEHKMTTVRYSSGDVKAANGWPPFDYIPLMTDVWDALAYSPIDPNDPNGDWKRVESTKFKVQLGRARTAYFVKCARDGIADPFED